MDVGTVLSVAQTLFAALQCSELKEMCSFLGYQSQLESLKATVATVNAVLLDAEAKRELSHEAQRYMDELKDAVYDADDLIDEFVTRAARKQRQLSQGRKVSDKVCLFFSRFKDLGVARNLSRGVKEVRQRLDVIANNHNKFGFKLDCEPIRKRREETCSYVYDKDIIGRGVDKEKIVGMLLDSNVKRDVSFLTIVGIGGLGKTSLAQLVYNDERVTTYFDLRLWACVSDEDPKHLHVKAVISKILESTTSQKFNDSSMEWLQCQLRQQLSGKKYLLVLDDVWNENHNEWLKLEKFFKEGLVGSWVVVTTRSKDTAKVVSGSEYDLEGLSEEDSWRLFERIAFGQGEDRENTPELAGIGQTIVKKCANVPLAIKVVASLLYGHGKDKWQSFEEISLGEITKDENGMSSILMLSYHNLDSRLKSCFIYCAIFSKDFRIDKKMLISLWRAQGYIVPLNSSQSMEDAAEEYFLILLRRCFFQDVIGDAYTGKIFSCKMHDLMHDISQKVAGKEVCVLNPMTSDLDKKTRHISNYLVRKHIEGETPFTHKIGVRTWLMCDFSAPIMELHKGALFANWVCLRTLDLHHSGIKILPCSIGNLLHLRYLDLSWNRDLEVLPKSITKLHNLQTFKLSYCAKLIELPNDFNKLVNLRLLDISQCSRLTHMPPGMGKLNGLQWLTMFVVGVVDQLKDLKALTNLKGYLVIYIRIPKDVAYVKGNNSYQGGYLSDKQWLNAISFEWGEEEREANEEYEAALLDDLQPHSNLREVSFYYYRGKRLARWIIESNFGTFFSNLVQISFHHCPGLQHLMSLEKLPHLRALYVSKMMKLEYMEDTRRNTSRHDMGACFFPSLVCLTFEDLPELKGWWRDDDQDQVILRETTAISSLLPSFPRLSHLVIRECPKLTRIPLCPEVKNLKLYSFNERLRVIEKAGRDLTRGPATQSLNSSLPSLSDSGNPKLRVVTTDCVRGLMAGLPIEAFQCVTEMRIWNDKEVESLEEVGELFQSCSSSLQILRVENCPNLKCLSYPEQEEEEDDDGDMPWRCLHQSLRSLEFYNLPKLVKLPKGMQYLTSLQSLNISSCRALESLPGWMPSLTSLTKLELWSCSERLVQRWQSPTGEDWPHIQHIPNVEISR